MVATLRMVVEYDGTDFAGWQVQPNARTVQEEIERALRQVLQKPVSIVGGGRTDAGVHARGQVASFRTEGAVDPATLQRSLNGVLPEDVVVRKLDRVPDEFHARYSARERRYVYTIMRRPTALERRFSWQLFYRLDLPLLDACAAQLVGGHDYASFCKADSDVKETTCTVRSAAWTLADDVLRFEIAANRFLYGMVRALVGTQVDVARGYTPVEAFRTIFDAKDRRAAGVAAPARGLCLEEIRYDDQDLQL